MFTKFCCSVVVLVYMEIDHIKAIFDDPQWTEHVKDPQMKQIKRQTSLNIQ
jgi:hypothetical protein